MAKARRIDAWNHTSHILAKIHNVHCTEKNQLLQPWQINPYGKNPVKAPTRRISVDDLDAVYDPKTGIRPE